MSLLNFPKMLAEKRNYPKPVTESFAGRTILVTGATGGIGLEAAKKLAALNADRVLITARNESKAHAAKKEIEAFLQTQGSGKSSNRTSQIITRILDMSTFAGVQAFVRDLRTEFPMLDGVILNAGAMFSQWEQSGDGWENTLNVNALSTFLLGVLLLPLLIARADAGDSDYKPHLTFVSSGTAWLVQTDKERAWIKSDDTLKFVSAQKNFPSGAIGGAAQYGRSKLVLEYAIRQLAASPAIRGPDGHPKVIVNSTCPGVTKSDLGRQMSNPFLRFASSILTTFFARETEQGANSYISALLQGEDLHGNMWKNDQKYQPFGLFASAEGAKFGDKVWKDMRELILKTDPSTKLFLNGN